MSVANLRTAGRYDVEARTGSTIVIVSLPPCRIRLDLLTSNPGRNRGPASRAGKEFERSDFARPAAGRAHTYVRNRTLDHAKRGVFASRPNGRCLSQKSSRAIVKL